MKIRIKKRIQKDLEERYPSAAAGLGHVHPDIPPKGEHDGHVERSEHQGLRNVTEEDIERMIREEIDVHINRP